MKLIQQSAEIWQQPEGEIGIYKQVERAARLCYKSEDKVTEDSYKRFINMLNDKGHNSPLEHGSVYLTTDHDEIIERYKSNPYSKVTEKGWDAYITTNFRVLLENKIWLDDLKYFCEPTEYHEKRISVHIITNRAISHELVRHRAFSFSQESQRYCNYSKDKFNNELTFIIPNWVTTTPPYKEKAGPTIADVEWSNALLEAEKNYFTLLKEGWKPQQAREVLPNSTKTELIMTGFESDWEQFFRLRCSPAAHPMMQELANKIKTLIHNEGNQQG